MSRVRSRPISNSLSGTRLVSFYGGPFTENTPPNTPVVMTNSVTDEPGRGLGDCNRFTVDVYTPPGSGSYVGNGQTSTTVDGYNKIKYVDFVVRRNWSQGLSHGITAAPTLTSLATKLAASTNPSRSVVNASAAIGELRDIPELFARKHAGVSINEMVQAGVDSRFKFRFGIAPMISDLRNIFNFTESVEKRMKELERLYSRGGLRRTQSLGTYRTSFPSIDAASRESAFRINFFGMKYTTETIKGHIRWKPDSPMKGLPDGKRLRREASAAVVGGNSITPETLWELIPFSWLVDWFTTVGDLASLTNNGVPCHIDKLVIMTKTETILEHSYVYPETFGGHPIEGLTISGGSSRLTTKSRTPAGIGLSAHLPLLNAGQLLTATDLLLKLKK